MKRATIIAAIIVIAFSAAALAAVPVEVAVGKGTVITLTKNAKRVALSDPAVADMVLFSPREILINGKKAGSTSLITWDEDGNKTFFDVAVYGDLGDLRKKIEAVAPGGDVVVETAGGSILLSGTARSAKAVAKIDALSKAYGASVLNFVRVSDAEQVILEVKVAQINRSKLKELGISALVKGIGGDNAELTTPGFVASPGGNLGGDAGTDVTPGIEGFDLDSNTPQIGVTHFPSGISAFLRALQSNGLSTLLAEPNLIVKSGETGEFLAGSRVPVQQVTGTGSSQTVSIVYEEVGVKLNFKPEVLDDGSINLKIDPAEVSSVAEFLNFQGIIAPQIDTRTVSTSVQLKEGESLVLAGLLSDEMKENIQKVPILGDIPILGAIFRSTSDELQSMELAFFITPRLVKPIAPGAIAPTLPGQGDKAPTEQEKKGFNWIPLGFSSDKPAEETAAMEEEKPMMEEGMPMEEAK